MVEEDGKEHMGARASWRCWLPHERDSTWDSVILACVDSHDERGELEEAD